MNTYIAQDAMLEHFLSQFAGNSRSPKALGADCTDNAVGSLKELFVDLVMGGRLSHGQAPALRPVFLKTHGAALGLFTVRKDLPEDLRVGVFAHGQFPVAVRFSSDTLPNKPDLQTTLGIAMKLVGVPGRKLLIPDALTCDFILQNHPVFFLDTAKDMCEFTRAGVVDGDYAPYLAAHPITAKILQDMQKTEASLLSATYWGLLPHRFGEGRYVKYKLEPALNDPSAGGTAKGNNYLYADLKTRLLSGPAVFEFSVQIRADETMPLDKATVAWEESAHKPVPVATLTLPAQNIDAPGLAALAEALAFNIWQTLPQHEPVGSIAEARRVVYSASALLRRETNHVSTEEPKSLPALAPTRPPDETIVRAEIHPAIGVARVGNSKDEFFIGPEVTNPPGERPGFYKDKSGALKRQAARFRLFGFNTAGEVVSELTADNAVIEWTVHVANKKGAWYNFTLAMDRQAATDPKVEPARRRNAYLRGADRSKLSIDPGSRSIHGRDTSGSGYRFDSGSFLGEPVYLGELRTDDAGRLVFLGGRGVSRSPTGVPPLDFANNDGWYDDISDGPVSARVLIGGREIPVESAWVTVAPPNYAPQLKSVRTMYDLLEDRFGPFDDRLSPLTDLEPSFQNHLLPIFERMCALQWVNAGFAAQFGWGSPNEFVRRDFLARLASKNAADKEFRQQIYNTFRDYSSNNGWDGLWPFCYGDTMDVPGSANRDLALSNLQLGRLKMWAAGAFKSDYDPTSKSPESIDQTPLDFRPAMLTRAALDFCLADAFHPGCEIGWIIRSPWIFNSGSKPPQFRFRQRAAGTPDPDYGDVLVPAVATSSSGPLNSLSPGELTRWMAVPWQTDTASCRSGYEGFTSATPTFWPARVPNQVLTEEDYKQVINTSVSLADRSAAFRTRPDWLSLFGPGGFNHIRQMVNRFGELGVVESRVGPEDGHFPKEILVESVPGMPDDAGTKPTLSKSTSDVQVLASADALKPRPDHKVPPANFNRLPGEYVPKVDRYRVPKS